MYVKSSIYDIIKSGTIPAGIPPFKPPPMSIVNIDQADNRTLSFLDILYQEPSALIVLPLLFHLLITLQMK